MVEPGDEGKAPVPSVFATTHWSVVQAAGQEETVQALAALEKLCRDYWFPIYVYVRRKGRDMEDAKDLTQEFFTQFIHKHHIRQADKNKGKFRTFLLAALEHFLAREWNRAHRQKRGGQFSFISLDQEAAEERYLLEPAHSDTPEKEFMRQWALSVLDQVMKSLEIECAERGKGALFREAKTFLSGERDAGVYSGIAQRLGMAEGAVRVAVHRLRQRYGELLRNAIAQTVSTPEEVDEEMRFLLEALSQ
jgi:RNA polymerase sigma-70 factor (ECF subfamily)